MEKELLEKIERMQEYKSHITVKQLISILETCNPDAHIMINNAITNWGHYLQREHIKIMDGLIFLKTTV